MTAFLDDLRHGDGPLPRFFHQCPVCERRFLGRSDQRYCGGTCRKRAERASTGQRAE